MDDSTHSRFPPKKSYLKNLKLRNFSFVQKDEEAYIKWYVFFKKNQIIHLIFGDQ